MHNFLSSFSSEEEVEVSCRGVGFDLEEEIYGGIWNCFGLDWFRNFY
jgi:hypothetical protein